jgi:hypothetical protein
MLRTRAILVAFYGGDKLDDPVKAEPVILQPIQNDPADPANFYQLGTALQAPVRRPRNYNSRQRRVKRSNTYRSSRYDRQGCSKKIAALEARKSPTIRAFYTMSVHYWNEAYRARLSDSVKQSYVQKEWRTSIALKLKADYVEAMNQRTPATAPGPL